jgi:hypothetical protein
VSPKGNIFRSDNYRRHIFLEDHHEVAQIMSSCVRIIEALPEHRLAV